MLAIVIDLLGGRYAAAAYNDRNSTEWPPHPARFFSALVATWAEGSPETPEGDAELEALRWLEGLPAPEILASSYVAERTVVKVFVPVNDVSVVGGPDRSKLDAAREVLFGPLKPNERTRALKRVEDLERKLLADTQKLVAAKATDGKGDAAKGRAVLPDSRKRQERTFPSAVPEYPRIGFVWPEVDAPPATLASVKALLRRLVRVGHSSTLVRAAVATQEDVAHLALRTRRFVPDDYEGKHVLRWVGPGQTDQLQEEFARHRETEPRVMPARFVRYSDRSESHEATVPLSVFEDDFPVFARIAGPRLPITSTAGLSRQFRRALMAHAEEPIDEIISGHRPDGAASETPHLAVMPLPIVVGPHADGALIGIGLALPRGCDKNARRAVMRAIGLLERSFQEEGESDGGAPVIALDLGASGVLHLQRVAWGGDPRRTLLPRTWTKPARRWASATPVALDRIPGELNHPDAEKRAAAFAEATDSVIEAVKRIGLPAPVGVDVLRSCVLAGTAKPGVYPRFPADRKRPQRVLVHVRLVFAERVSGPIVLGAGRYQGLGLCLGIDDGGDI